MANAQSFMETMLTSPDATFGIMLVANAGYAADYGDFQSEDRRTGEWREIADRLREQYGENLILPQVINDPEFIPGMFRGEIPNSLQEIADHYYEKLITDDSALSEHLKNPVNAKAMVIAAAEKRDRAGLYKLLSCGLNINAVAEDESALHAFLIDEELDMKAIQMLVEFGVDVNLPHRYRGNPISPLSLAIRKQNLELVNLIADAGANLDVENLWVSPLYVAAIGVHDYGHNTEMLEFLLNRGADVRRLIAALTHEDTNNDILRLLLSYNRIDVNDLDEYGTLLIQATYRGAYENAKTLLEAGADPNISLPGKHAALVAAVRYSHLKFIPLLLQYGADIDANVDGKTALYCAVINDSLSAARMLLEAGANTDLPKRGDLIIAAWNKPEMLKLLRSYRVYDLYADITLRVGRVEKAAERGKAKKVYKLIDLISRKFLEEIIKGTNQTAFSGAVRGNHPEIVREMIRRDVSPDLVVWDDTRKTALIGSIEHGFDEIVEMLLEAGADPNKFCEDGYGPIHAATFQDRSDFVKDLIYHGANIDSLTVTRQTALMIATDNQDINMVLELLNQGADPRFQSDTKVTPLMLAAELGNVEIGEALLIAGANLNTQNVEGQTALMYACRFGHLDFVKLLLNQDEILTDLRTKGKKTAADIVLEAGHLDIYEVLKAASFQHMAA